MPDETSQADERITELEQRLAAEPSSRVFLDLARAYHAAGQFGKAAEVCSRGLGKHPGWLSARVMLGRIQFEMGSLDEAKQSMQQVLDAAPDNLIARRVLAEISLEQGDREGALDRYRALLAFNPADAETRSRIRELDAAGAAAPAEEPAASVPPAERQPMASPEPLPGPAPEPEAEAAPEPLPEPAPAREPGVLATPTLAEIYLQQGLTDQAIEVYREILEGDPANKEAATRLAEIEAALPSPPDPLAALRRRKIDTLSAWLRAIRGEQHA